MHAGAYYPPIRRRHVLMRGREPRFGRKPIVDAKYTALRKACESSGDRPVCRRRTRDEPTTVDVEDDSRTQSAGNEPLSTHAAASTRPSRQAYCGKPAVRGRRSKDTAGACRERVFWSPALASYDRANGAAEYSCLPATHPCALG